MPNHTTEDRRLRSDVQSILDCLLLRALEISQASYGNVQLMDWDAGHLVIKAQYGFQDELRFFKRVKLGEGSACAQALEDSGSVLVEDVMEDALLLPYRQIMRRAEDVEIVAHAHLTPTKLLPLLWEFRCRCW